MRCHRNALSWVGTGRSKADLALNHLVSAANAMLVFGSYFEKFMGFPTLLIPVIFYTPVSVLHPAKPLVALTSYLE